MRQTKEEKEKPKAEKKAAKETINRAETVAKAIRKLCKHGATMQEIMDESDALYVKAGGKSNPTATNVNRYALSTLVEFEVLSLGDNGKYKFNK